LPGRRSAALPIDHEEAMSSPVDLKCPNCAKVLRVPPAVFGKKIKCKHCQHAFVVEDPAAKPARSAPKTGASGDAAPRPPFLDDDDDGPVKIEVITDGDEIPRCPHCAQELDPPDAIVCVHCGFNNVTRAKAETRRVWAPSFEDWFRHLWPGVTALSIVIGWIVFDIISLNRMREWLEGSFLEMDEKDAAGRKRYFVPPGFFIAVIWTFSLVVMVPAGRFAYKRLIKEFRPPERIKI
jgi:hypothetical protein